MLQITLSLFILSSQMEEMAKLLPEKALTLEFVTRLAIEASDSFKQIRAEAKRTEVQELESESFFDPSFKSQFQFQNNQNEPMNSFQPSGEKGWSSQVGVSSNIPTGTNFSANVAHQKNQFSGQPSPTSPFHFNRVEFQARQSLVRDIAGIRGRNLLRSGTLSSRAAKLEVVQAAEDLWLQYADLFYRAWLLQRETEAADSRLKRRSSLESISDKRFKRGTSESADHLQVQAAKLTVESEFVSKKINLNEIWRALILSLQLPPALLEWNPALVPVRLDNPQQKAVQICSSTKENDLLQTNTTLLLAQAQAASGIARARANQNSALPELTAYASLSSGNEDDRFQRSLNDSFALKNKGWMVGVQFDLPLFLKKERAEKISARAAADRLSASAAQQRTSVWVEFLNLCDFVSEKSKLLESQKLIVKKQINREMSLEKRYRIGNAAVFDLVQAGDDRSLSESQLYALEVDVRFASWKIIRLSGGLVSTLSEALHLEVK